MAIKLSTGKIAFPIEFDNGDKDCIYFNPNDPDLATRFIEAKDRISKRVEEMQFTDFELDNHGEPVVVSSFEEMMNLPEDKIAALKKQTEGAIKVVQEAKQIIFDELDTAFDSKVSAVLFKHCSPLGIVNGEYYILSVLNALTPEIQKNVEKANAQAEEKMKKHLKKYGYGNK